MTDPATPPIPADPPDDAAWPVAVRTLCDFAARSGDLDLRFTPAPSAQQGLEGHRLVAARRAPPYQAEVPLQGRWGPLLLRGRADGVDPTRPLLEEVKTHRGPLQRQAANQRALHWAQAEVYGWLLCRQHGWTALTLALVYVDIANGQETRLERPATAADLQRRVDALCGAYLAWARHEAAHRTARQAALAALPFARPHWRSGQRLLAGHAFHAAHTGRVLLAQAPTGIGKTLGTLYPALRAMARPDGPDKLLVLSAKGSGRQLAMDGLAQLAPADAGLPLRVVELAAQAHACVHPDRQCHGASCPLAAGFYDRLPAARAAAVGLAAADGAAGPAPPAARAAQAAPVEPGAQAAPARADVATLAALAAAHQVCPYHLGHELVRWADVVVGDYHHAFDPTAWLPGLAQANGWRLHLLVDEVHNLVERGRDMHSVQLSPETLQAARREAPAALRRPLERLRRAWRAAATGLDAEAGTGVGGHATAPALPEGLLPALQAFSQAASDLQAGAAEPGSAPLVLPPAVQALHFGALQFARLADTFGAHSLFERGAAGSPVRGRPALPPVGIRNIWPGPLLAPRWSAAHGAVAFSATLEPAAFYARQLGLPADHAFLDVPSPFEPGQLQVRVARQLSTRWGRRAASLPGLADLIADQHARQPGNYLAFFSSFDYLEQALAMLRQRHPALPMWAQQRGMDAAARQAFLDRFTEGGQGIGLAVLGGSFAEGVDLPGRRLIGAFVATLGLPQLNPVNEALRRHLDALHDDGYAAIYLYPGLRKVVQAAGRVIRGPEDRGTLWLIDDRYGRAEVRRLLPRWWQLPDAAGG